ncbi:MAG TPA: TetR family transcriptional regulator C-terminal domain-containing protein [Rhizobium sp.]|nr:TetR family transcriptional regulator C-terminal domain-containing protein [Rhizobium sp.]
MSEKDPTHPAQETPVRRSFHRAGEAERRKALIRATLDCISEYGLEGATVRQIAARAGVTGGLIRHYFSGKDQMLEAAYREIMDTMSSAAFHALEHAGDDPRARLHDFIVANLTPPVTDPRTMSLWAAFISHVRVDPGFAKIQRENYLAYLAVLQQLVEKFLADAGRPAPADTCRKLAIAINGMIDGLWLEGSLADDLFEDDPLPGIALAAVELLLGGLSLSEGRGADSEAAGR